MNVRGCHARGPRAAIGRIHAPRVRIGGGGVPGSREN
jgi:hypothetical protein